MSKNALGGTAPGWAHEVAAVGSRHCDDEPPPPLEPGRQADAGRHAVPRAGAAGGHATLWVSWQLDGGAAAVNEAGRLRMQAYRMAMSVGTDDAPALRSRRPSSSAAWRCCARRPRAAAVRALGRRGPRALRRGRGALARSGRAGGARAGRVAALPPDTAAFVTRSMPSSPPSRPHMSRWTALLHLCSSACWCSRWRRRALLLYRLPLRARAGGAAQGCRERLQQGDLGARVERSSSDEFGTLADGFNEHGRAPAVDVPQPRGQGQREDRAARGKARAAGGAVRGDDARRQCDHARRAGAGLRAAHRAASRTPTRRCCAGPTRATSAS